MSEKRLNGRIVNKHDTEANWAKATNFIPMLGEVIVYDADSITPFPRVKIGDGKTVVSSLPFVASDKVDKEPGMGLSANNYTTAEKEKLAGIFAGAEVNQNAFSNVKVGSTTIVADSKTDTLTLAAGSNVKLTPDASNDKITIEASYPVATQSSDGLMSAADKQTLDTLDTYVGDSPVSVQISNAIQNHENENLGIIHKSGSIVSTDSGVYGTGIDAISYIEPVQSGSGDASPENVRPISGWDAINVNHSSGYVIGFDEAKTITYSNGFTVTTKSGTSEFVINGTSTGTSNASNIILTQVLPAGLYTIQMEDLTGGAYCNVGRSGGNSTEFARSLYDGSQAQFELKDETTIAISMILKSGVTYNNQTAKIRCVAGTEMVDSVSYNPIQTITATLPEITPKGKHDWRTGILTKTHHKIVFDGVTTGKKMTGTDLGRGPNYAYMHGGGLDYPIKNRGEIINSHGLNCAMNTVISLAGSISTLSGATSSDSSAVVAEKYNTVLKQWYDAGTPLEVVYEIATPVEFQLTPQQLNTLEGLNNVWSNTGETEAWINVPSDHVATADSVITQTLPSGTDLNNLVDNGYYVQFVTATAKAFANNPLSNKSTGICVKVYSRAGDVYQEVSGTLDGGIYKRRFSGSSWSSWVQMATTSDNVASATKATQDANGNVIASTYISKHGGTIANRNNSSATYDTSALEVREYNYSGAGADSWSQAPRLSFNWNNRATAQIGLASNGYLYTSPNADEKFYKLMYEDGTWDIAVKGNAGTATKLSTPRTISLTGGVTGSATFDGSANASITATVDADSHNHSNYALANQSCSNKDFNDLTATGFYYGYTGMTHAAAGSSISVLEVINYSKDWIVQRQTVINATPITYERTRYNGSTWSEWHEIYTTVNRPSLSAIGAAATSHNHSASEITAGTLAAARLPAATTSAQGAMSAADKTKLDGIATGANKTTVDTALSSTSTNPVQNKVVNTAISSLNTLVGGTKVSTQISDAISKLDMLTIDITDVDTGTAATINASTLGGIAASEFATHEDVSAAIAAALNSIQNASGVSF